MVIGQSSDQSRGQSLDCINVRNGVKVNLHVTVIETVKINSMVRTDDLGQGPILVKVIGVNE